MKEKGKKKRKKRKKEKKKKKALEFLKNKMKRPYI
jgi:hypothetical protein